MYTSAHFVMKSLRESGKSSGVDGGKPMSSFPTAIHSKRIPYTQRK